MTTGSSEDNIVPFEIPVGMTDSDCQEEPDQTTRAIGFKPLRDRCQKIMSILMNFNDILDAIESGEAFDPESPVVIDLMLTEIEKGLHLTDVDECPDE